SKTPFGTRRRRSDRPDPVARFGLGPAALSRGLSRGSDKRAALVGDAPSTLTAIVRQLCGLVSGWAGGAGGALPLGRAGDGATGISGAAGRRPGPSSPAQHGRRWLPSWTTWMRPAEIP